MFEIFKALFDAVLHLAPKLARARRDRRFVDLGVDLYFVYIAGNEVLAVGGEIIAQLEFLAGPRKYITPGRYEQVRSELMTLVGKQSRTLVRLGAALYRMRHAFYIVAPEGYTRLVGLASGKQNMVALLSQFLHEGTLPLAELADSEMSRLADENFRYYWSSVEANAIMEGWSRGRLNLNLSSELDESVRPLVVEYLSTWQPRQALDHIREALMEIRAALAANFSTEEILLRVADPRICDETVGQAWIGDTDYRWVERQD